MLNHETTSSTMAQQKRQKRQRSSSRSSETNYDGTDTESEWEVVALAGGRPLQTIEPNLANVCLQEQIAAQTLSAMRTSESTTNDSYSPMLILPDSVLKTLLLLWNRLAVCIGLDESATQMANCITMFTSISGNAFRQGAAGASTFSQTVGCFTPILRKYQGLRAEYGTMSEKRAISLVLRRRDRETPVLQGADELLRKNSLLAMMSETRIAFVPPLITLKQRLIYRQFLEKVRTTDPRLLLTSFNNVREAGRHYYAPPTDMAASYQPEPGLIWDNVPDICNRWSERVLGLYQDTMTQGLNVCPPVTPQGVLFSNRYRDVPSL